MMEGATDVQHRLRILELYSGIGGMHVAAKERGLPFDIVGSYEINPTALEVYRYNFPKTPKAYNIMGLTLDHLESLAPDIIMMSPPCQPFTRQGLQRDIEDARTSSLLHVLGLLQEVPNPPKMILLENVAGFEKSKAREQLLEVLKKREYKWQEFLLSPTQLGIPNSRLRYYLLAKRQPISFCFNVSDKVEETFPLCLCIEKAFKDTISDTAETCTNCSKPRCESLQSLLSRFHTTDYVKNLENCKSYSDVSSSINLYLDKSVDVESHLLKDKILNKYCMILDIVDRDSTRSCCFTKGYGHYVEGTGSVVKENIDVELEEIYAKAGKMDHDDPQRLEILRQLKLRYFSAKEIAKLMCFPEWFTFPKSLSIKQKYRVLGNSINILVVTSLLIILCEN